MSLHLKLEWAESREQTMRREKKAAVFSNSYIPFYTDLVFFGLWWNIETNKKAMWPRLLSVLMFALLS